MQSAHVPRRHVAAASLALMLTWSVTAAAQTPASVGPIDFNRPEAWAMKYFTSAALLGPPPLARVDASGRINLGVDLVWLPALSPARELVGFNGTAHEDLNKAPLFARPRVTFALSDRLTVTAAGLPPVRFFGITPRLLALGAGWRFTAGGPWVLLGRVHGQIGTVTGAITCPSDVLVFTPGSAGNPTGCERESSDVTSLRYLAFELDAGRRLTSSGRLAVQGSLAATVVDGVFQTDAQTFGVRDRTRLASRGLTYSASLGMSYAVGDRAAFGAEVFYAPIRVLRPSDPSPETDGLLTIRGLLTYRLH
jgi:hypothetical protein